MVTKALAVAGVVALTTTLLSPSVASMAATPSEQGPTPVAAPEPSAPTSATRASDGRRAGQTVRDHQRRDPSYVRPAFDADAIKVYPRFRRGWLFIQVHGDTLNRGRRFNAIEVHLQTRGDRRPDYRIVHRLSRDGDGLSGTYLKRIRRWEGSGHYVSCRRLSAKWRISARTRWVEFDIPRRCIQRRGQVRVNAETWNYTDYSPLAGRADAVPATYALSRWI